MNGYYRINKQGCKRKLRYWLINVIQEQRWIQYDDLHIDEVSKAFQARNRWFYSGLFLLDCLWRMLDQPMYDCFLCMPLLETNKKTNVNDINVDYIKRNLHDMTPPSLYIVSKNSTEYNEWFKEWEFLDRLSSSEKWNIYFGERYEYGIFVRGVFFQPKCKLKKACKKF